MSDIFGAQALGGGGISLRFSPNPSGPQVPQVTAIANDASATFKKGSDLPGQNGDSFDTSKSKRDDEGAYAPFGPRDAQTQKQRFDADTQTGPPPSFQANFIEVENDLRNVIAQIEAKRAQGSDANAIAPAPLSHAAVTDTQSTPQDSAALAPTVRRDLREDAPEPVATPLPEVVVAAPHVAIKTEVQDREAAYSGRTATPDTPYSNSTEVVLS